MHQQFWDEVPDALKDDPQELTMLRRAALKMQSEGFLWQKEAWTSIGLSLAAGKRTVSPNYEAAKESFLKFAESIDVPSEAIEEGLNHAEGMLVAAANKREFLGPEGSITLSRELVEHVLSGIEGSQDRLRVLLNPTGEIRPNDPTTTHIVCFFFGTCQRRSEGGNLLLVRLI